MVALIFGQRAIAMNDDSPMPTGGVEERGQHPRRHGGAFCSGEDVNGGCLLWGRSWQDWTRPDFRRGDVKMITGPQSPSQIASEQPEEPAGRQAGGGLGHMVW